VIEASACWCVCVCVFRPVISLLCGPGRQPWQVNSDLGYPIDPEGLNLVGIGDQGGGGGLKRGASKGGGR
jgi:hypothetical protein